MGDNNPTDGGVQTICAIFFQNCLKWPKATLTQAGFVHGRAVDLLKRGMAANLDNAELQLTCIETLAAYIDTLHCHRLVKIGGGEGLIKTIMIAHQYDDQIQTW